MSDTLKSTVELANTASAFNSTLANICNPERIINIVTLYMIHFLGLNMPKFIGDYVFDPKKDHVYPKVYQNMWAPEELPDYPDLEQAYWSIVNQYNNATESSLRYGRSRQWCQEVGYMAAQHCQTFNETCTANSTQEIVAFCNYKVYSYIQETCYRVLSIDPYRHKTR